MTHYLYSKAYEHYRRDDCLGALDYLSALSAERELSAGERELQRLIEGKIAHLATPEKYSELYEFLAREGEMSPIAWGVWRVQWTVERAAQLVYRGLATSLLDVGCQKGQITTWFGRQGLKRVVGVDISPTNIAAARVNPDNVPCISYQVADVEDLPFEDGEFDITLILSLLEHVRDPDKALSECMRVTRDKGFVFGHVPYGGYGYWTEEIARQEGNEEWLKRPFREHVRLWDPHKHLRFLHAEIEWNELTGDEQYPFACQGERAGEWSFMLIVEKETAQ